MRKLPLIVLIFVFGNLQAQREFIKKYSVAVDFNYPISMGDNFLNKGYNQNLGFNLEFQYNLGDFFVGTNYRGGSSTITDQSLIGNFETATNNSNSLFGGFRHFIKQNKMYLEHRIGYGESTISNSAGGKNYYIEGNILNIGTRLNYIENKTINFYAGFDLVYHFYDVKTAPQYKSFYNSGTQIIPTLGVKLLLGKSLKKKNVAPNTEKR